jgi:mevalonate kinase
MTRASAPGKIILFGEHAVVYGRPALAVPVTQVHADVEISDADVDSGGIWIDAPDVNLHAELNTLPSDHPIASVIHNLFFLSRISPFPNLEIKITSTIPVASGLGSGAAVTVALTRALATHIHYAMTDDADAVSAFAYEIEKLHHGTPSGIDNTVVTYAKPVYFTKGQPIETFEVSQPFTIVIADTGILAPTKESVGDVRKLWEANKAKWENVFDEVADISFAARHVIREGWIKMLGALMDENHTYLQEMTVSSPELDKLVAAARQAGALGAKMSGGGRGGNMIALVEEETAPIVAEALLSAGAKRSIIIQVS